MNKLLINLASFWGLELMQEYCLTCHGVEIEWRVEELIMSLRDTRNKTIHTLGQDNRQLYYK